jgi:hypothetical protein
MLLPTISPNLDWKSLALECDNKLASIAGKVKKIRPGKTSSIGMSWRSRVTEILDGYGVSLIAKPFVLIQSRRRVWRHYVAEVVL